MKFKKFIALLTTFKIVFKNNISFLFSSFFEIILDSVLPLFFIFFPKLVIEKLENKTNYYDLSFFIILSFAIFLILKVAALFIKNINSRIVEMFPRKVKLKIALTIVDLKYTDIENTEIQSTKNLANNLTNVTQIFQTFKKMISQVVSIIPLLAILLFLEWYYIIIVIFTIAIKITIVVFKIRHLKKIRVIEAENTKKYQYLQSFCLSRGGGKEIRTLPAEDFTQKKILNLRAELLNFQYFNMKKALLFNILTEALFFLQSFIVLLFLTIKLYNDKILIANYILYFSTITTLTIYLSNIAETISEYNKQILNALDYAKILLLKTENKNNNFGKVVDEHEEVKIEFKNVSFSYPGTNKKVLNNVNFKIEKNEKVTLVGLNGSGKTTIVKLLCKFYHPDEGTILFNDTDIWELNTESYYKALGVVFQDYMTFFFQIRESVASSEKVNDEALFRIFDELKISKNIDSFPQKEYTYITKLFSENGIELSGGEDQKIAIARALYKESNFLVLDEPTANLDPKSEVTIYENLLNANLNKTIIFISHRLAASVLADRIIVLKNGEIIESGNHEELMKTNSFYSKMYQKQKKLYEIGRVS